MRLPPDGNSEAGFACATSKIPQLLSWQPNAMVMTTVCVSTVSKLAESVEWLYDHGFRRINVTPDSRPDTGWNEETLESLAEQYRRIARFYVTCFEIGEPFTFPLFEEKIRMRLSGRCAACHLGYKQPSVSPDGYLYPCVQFLDQPDYVIGDVFNGLDDNTRRRIHRRSEEPIKSCEGCAIADRCRHHCACLNFQKTGDISLVSPAQCLHERLLIPIADEAAAKLFAMQSSIFLRRFYGLDHALI